MCFGIPASHAAVTTRAAQHLFPVLKEWGTWRQASIYRWTSSCGGPRARLWRMVQIFGGIDPAKDDWSLGSD